MFPWIFIFISLMGSVGGQIILKFAMQHLAAHRDPHRSLLLQILLSWRVLAGLFIYGCGVLFWLLALSYLEVSLVYPFATLSYIGILIASYFLFDERITRTRLLGIFIILGGVVLIGLSANFAV